MKQSKILTAGLRALADELRLPLWHDARFTILLDENTFHHCLPLLISAVEPLQEADFIELPNGEECKCLDVAAQVWQTLLESGADRNHVLVCLGGGALCDLGGFVAASYKRGIRHINVPTTLVAMADAAIGGKTGLDFGGLKNSIGVFYPSVVTCIERAFCDTLSPEQLLCGQMEMVKTAAVADAAFYEQLLADPTPRAATLREVARIKMRAVKADPYDHSIRHILNFGHTVGHALESRPDAPMPHGLAVGVGMLAAMYLSVRKVGLAEEVYNTYSQWLAQRVQVPHLTLRDIEPMLDVMHHDKKAADGHLQFVLLRAPGEAMIDVPVSDNELRDTLLHL